LLVRPISWPDIGVRHLTPDKLTPDGAAPRDPLVGVWLLLICALVVAMILVGGATRLTDSGLSITEWDIGKGLTPPLSGERWAAEFALYQRTAEYQVQNRGMSLSEFQAIYWWEWAHRFLGKAIGAAFALPFALFWATGRLRGRFWPVLGLFALGGAQGAIGWWMVVSGLEGRLDVSPVRLAVHLGMAFLILGLGVHLALGALGWPPGPRASKSGLPDFDFGRPIRAGADRGRATAETAPAADAPGGSPILVWTFVATLFAQILLGALMAGADAGAAFADWPTIGGEWFPSGYGLPSLIESRAALQFNHRMAGYAVLGLALVLAFAAHRGGEGPARAAAYWVGGLAILQAALGIAAILTGAHLAVSLIHQGGAVALWIAAMALQRATR
jgi:cytochrome c oxidase assembly protein subunit 15